MKKIIRLTERDLTRIVRRVINEQVPLIDILSTASDIGLDIPNYSDQLTQADRQSLKSGCKTYKSSCVLSLDLFSKLRGIAGQTNHLDKTIQSWILRLHNSITGVGASNDLSKVLSEIKTKQQMGSVLNAYYKKFGTSLHQDLSGEYTISWDTIWGIVKKFKAGISMDACKEYVQHQS
jgi:hypothetical protein